MTVQPPPGGGSEIDPPPGEDSREPEHPHDLQRPVLTPLPNQPDPPLDGFAITALVFGLIGGVVFAIGFGVASLRRIHRGERWGKSLLMIASVACVIWVVVLVAVLTHHSSQTLSRDPDGTVTKAGTGRVRIGDCVEISHGAAGKAGSVQVRPCDQLHNAQVFAIVFASGVDYPGFDALESDAVTNCKAELPGFLGKSDTQLRVIASVPTQAHWDEGVSERGVSAR